MSQTPPEVQPDAQPDVQFVPYGRGEFPEHAPFGQTGYRFVVPGTFPYDVRSHLACMNWQMAVYRRLGEWEVRDVNGHRKQWATGPSRRVAVGLAFAEIARTRRKRAAEIAEERVNVLGLEAAPPYQVEVTDTITLVLTPDTIGRLIPAGPGDTVTAGEHRVEDLLNDRDPYTLTDPRMTLRTMSIGVLHDRCDCDPLNAAQFETETDAIAYVAAAMAACWPCDARTT